MAESTGLVAGKAAVRSARYRGRGAHLHRSRRLGRYRDPASSKQDESRNHIEPVSHVQSPKGCVNPYLAQVSTVSGRRFRFGLPTRIVASWFFQSLRQSIRDSTRTVLCNLAHFSK
jgi:hypothetical protein